jgi:UDP-arabinose 4-epimerase
MKTVLVTGGAGYIGSHTLKALAELGWNPICLDNLSTGNRHLAGSAQFIHGDLSRAADLDRAFGSAAIDSVIHFASLALVEESCRDPYRYYRENVLNALNLLEAMRRHHVHSIVFSSSCATYGMPAELPISETCPLDPVNPYGATKMVVERILRDYDSSHGIRSVALRYFNAAGAHVDGTIGELHDPETHLIPRLLDVAAGMGGTAQIYGTDYPTADGTCVRDYIHVSDLAAAHIRSLEFIDRTDRSGVFNLGTGQGVSVLQVIQEVKRVTGLDFPVVHLPRRAGDPPALVADPRKAHELLGWHAAFSSIANIVETAWNWQRRRDLLLGRKQTASAASD